MQRMLIVGLSAMLVAPGVLAAQGQAFSEESLVIQEKGPAKAQLLAIAHWAIPTAAGLVLMNRGADSDLYAVPGFWLASYGIVGGPSMGNLYARDHRRTRTGFAIRSAGALLIAKSAWQHLLSGAFDPDKEQLEPLGWDAFNVVGAGLLTAGTAYSIATAPVSAAEYNRSVQASTTPHISLSPRLSPAEGSVGMYVVLRF